MTIQEKARQAAVRAVKDHVWRGDVPVTVLPEAADAVAVTALREVLALDYHSAEGIRMQVERWLSEFSPSPRPEPTCKPDLQVQSAAPEPSIRAIEKCAIIGTRSPYAAPETPKPEKLTFNRCDGRYPVPHQRDEPFPVTYRCGLALGHLGNCADSAPETPEPPRLQELERLAHNAKLQGFTRDEAALRDAIASISASESRPTTTAPAPSDVEEMAAEIERLKAEANRFIEVARQAGCYWRCEACQAAGHVHCSEADRCNGMKLLPPVQAPEGRTLKESK